MNYLTLSLGLFMLFSGLSCKKQQVSDTSRDLVEQQIPLDTLIQNAALEIIQNAYYCSLITLDEKGIARSRIMEPFPPEKNWEIWMATNPRSRKVAQLENNNQVTLYYFDRANLGYVSLMGKAYLVNDNRQKEQYWKEEWKAFYANKTDAYLLIKFVPDWIEVISVKHGINGDPVTWQPGRSAVRD